MENDRRASLRNKAETLVADLSPVETVAQPNEILMHELLVHKVELEMQNEELRKAHIAMEESRDRYVDRYEFSPISYITLSREELMTEINSTGCTQLGVDRHNLINRRFSNYIASQDQDRWHRLFMSLMERNDIKKQAFALEMIRVDGSTIYAFLNCQKQNAIKDLPVLHIALTDISQLKLDAQQY